MEKIPCAHWQAVSKLAKLYQKDVLSAPLDPYDCLLRRDPLLEKIFALADYGVAIFDASKASYIYISESLEHMLSYRADAFRAGGLAFAFSIVHPDDVLAVVQILEKELDFLQTLPVDQRLEHRSSYDYRFRRADGTYIRVLQRNTVLALDADGRLLHRLIVLTDISHLKKDDSRILNLNTERDFGNAYTYNTVEHTIVKDNFPSKRELQVLKLLGAGRTSKQIATELAISVHTVETHRRNMLAKANVKDTSKLVSLALASGLI
ncbi:helix-turn-helix transcriptional regulator [Hymenobacter jejuensis]|uniref:HTH luxR-type domain-containing protein n=1 Tax=Hymenobacter jejuensis TaxID=2502781 RepID=A0A5B7ZUB3_9BACT|nr:LuxR C-terminal-related transcriptional regulator [Hymenobacter jejuensis]QDA58784.1 hypothetical protein FHG12_01105 [Hymenobacter jejuensis]